jgi:malate dehydrogenase (oxaloacetate-decarboxylating)
VLLQWEDFAKNNATRMLERYRDRLCTFNDDVQGTAAVATGTLLSAINVTGVPLTEQRIAVMGAGSAGCGIASLIRKAMRDAGSRRGRPAALLHGRSRRAAGRRDDGLASFQKPFLQAKAAVDGWQTEKPGQDRLLDTVRNAKPTVLIGVSGQAGAFSEPVVRAMAENNKRPVIFPLSNPTSREEATPEDIEAWTEGRALIGTAVRFPPILRDGASSRSTRPTIPISSRCRPGRARGRAPRAVSATACSWPRPRRWPQASPAKRQPEGNLLPPVTALRDVAVTVALAVALQAHKEGLAKDARSTYRSASSGQDLERRPIARYRRIQGGAGP